MFEIYFEDLKPEVQKRLLKFCKLKNQYQMNWDVFPLAEIEEPEEGWDYEADDNGN